MRTYSGILILILALPAFGGIVTNGTFDTGVADWTFTAADGGTWRSSGGNPGGYAVLNNSPGAVPTMTQTVALILGHTYSLTWDMVSAYRCCSSSQTPGVGAAIDGNLWEFIVPSSQANWLSYTRTFVYSGGSSALAFSAQRNGTDTDVGIDNVVLTDLGGPTGVPEPATVALLGAGGLALAILRRRIAR